MDGTEFDGPRPDGIEERLKSFLGQFVAFMQGDQTAFGVLGTNGTFYGSGNFGFLVAAVKEVRVIEAPVEKNIVRAVIVL